MSDSYIQKLKQAEVIVQDYGKLLATITLMVHAHPVSLLPHSKDQIKDAIQLILKEIGTDNNKIKDSLIEAYVLLAKFIAEEDAEIIAKGHSALTDSHAENYQVEDAELATKIVNNIKLEMESLMEDLKIFLT